MPFVYVLTANDSIYPFLPSTTGPARSSRCRMGPATRSIYSASAGRSQRMSPDGILMSARYHIPRRVRRRLWPNPPGSNTITRMIGRIVIIVTALDPRPVTSAARITVADSSSLLVGRPAGVSRDRIRPSGNAGSKRAVSHVLKSRAFPGEVKFNGRWHEGSHDPIKDPELWGKAGGAQGRQRALGELETPRAGGRSSAVLRTGQVRPMWLGDEREHQTAPEPGSDLRGVRVHRPEARLRVALLRRRGPSHPRQARLSRRKLDADDTRAISETS